MKYKSLQEQYIDSLGSFGEAVIDILGAVAAQERLRISERTKAGLARVRDQGQPLGRPRGGREIKRRFRNTSSIAQMFPDAWGAVCKR